jgi:coenzyme F420-reducing hydrogenase gamma subunit
MLNNSILPVLLVLLSNGTNCAQCNTDSANCNTNTLAMLLCILALDKNNSCGQCSTTCNTCNGL